MSAREHIESAEQFAVSGSSPGEWEKARTQALIAIALLLERLVNESVPEA